jgi:hypothetical protein
MAVSSLDGVNTTVKQVSRATYGTIQKMVFDALRVKSVWDGTPEHKRKQLYLEADRRYGIGLLNAVGKRIGLIVPRQGPGARFVLGDRLLRLLVVALCPQQRVTYEHFKRAAEVHYGLAFDEEALRRASVWSDGTTVQSFDGQTDEWLIKVLDESGVLRKLSDSCALVENMTAPRDQEEEVA